jgi:hypothetical protein
MGDVEGKRTDSARLQVKPMVDSLARDSCTHLIVEAIHMHLLPHLHPACAHSSPSSHAFMEIKQVSSSQAPTSDALGTNVGWKLEFLRLVPSGPTASTITH